MLKKYIHTLLLSFFTLFSVQSVARTYDLTLVDKDTEIVIPLDEIRKQSNLSFSIYEPFLKKQVQMQGILLDDLLKKHLSYVPKNITLYAIDGYKTNFNSWKKQHWVIVTHENGKELTVRTKGPLKVVESNIEDKNVKNLQGFNDWVWMLNKIEVQP